MRLLTVLACALLAVGCGGGDSPSSRLEGEWLARDAADATVGYGINFLANGTYSKATVVVTAADQASNSGSANLVEEAGTFSATQTLITFSPTQNTCPGPDPAYSLAYEFIGPNLTLVGTAGAETFAPNTSTTTATLTIRFGCYDSAGNFTVSPLATVN
jgi:hypothetical protein